VNYINTKESFEAILNSLTDGVIVANLKGEFMFFNPAAAKILGMGSKDITQSNWSEVYGCYKVDCVTPYPYKQLPLSRAIKGEEVFNERVFIKNPSRADGVWISISASPLKNKNNNIYGGVIIFRDINNIVNKQNTLELFRNGVEQTADSVVITSLEGVFEYVNPAFEITSGYQKHEVLGKTPKILNSGKHKKAFYKNLWDTITSGKSYRGTIINKKKNGALYWSDQTITPLKDRNGNMIKYVSVLKDITEERKKNELELQLKVARTVQQMYYNTEITVPGYDIAGGAFPADGTGGDYYDFIPMPDGRFAIIIGDVIGHGIGAALIMAEVRAFLRAFTKTDTNPSLILKKLNDELFVDLQTQQYVTMVFAILNPESHQFIYASAGHLPWFLVNPYGKYKSQMKSTGLPLGISKKYDIKNSEVINLNKEDIAIFFTDGVIEARSPNEYEFGINRALSLVDNQKQKSSKYIIENLYSEIRNFSNYMPQEDDITTIICQIAQN
jgi:sigma-B regulation protein RsbU (phosphoserine phosphatase)